MQTSSRVPAHHTAAALAPTTSREEGATFCRMPFSIRGCRDCALLAAVATLNFSGGGSKGGRCWWRRRQEAPKQLLLFVYATQQHTSSWGSGGGVQRGPSPALGGPPHHPPPSPHSPCLIFEGWGCLNNSSQSSQCPVRHHLSPQECG